MARPTPLPLLLRAAAALLLLLTCASPAVSLPPCPPCGSSPVPYPLSTGPTCGDPAYRIRCSAAALLFDSSNNTYPITSISAADQRLTVAPAPFLPDACVAADLPTNGLQLDPAAPFNITGANTILYLNCTAAILNSPLNCTATSLCHAYANATAGACRSTPCCAFRAGGSTTAYRIRVRQAGCRAYRSFVGLDPGLPVDRWPRPGVELQWALPAEPTCGGQGDCGPDSTCRPDPNSNRRVRRCFCHSGLRWDPVAGVCVTECQNRNGCDKDRTALIAGLTSGLGATLISTLIAFLAYKRHRRIRDEKNRIARERQLILNSGGATAKLFTGKQIKRATNNFSRDNLLGSGGYGEVYRAILLLDDPTTTTTTTTTVAVKCAKLGNPKGTDQLLNEVRILCQVNHRSLVRLLGCCVELDQPLLVYEYIPNGALSDHLTNPTRRGLLSWTRRLSIARDTADGLAYLHSSAVPQIYHRDVKSSNILLDEKLNGKVSDFGLSRLAQADVSHVTTCAQGTLGYLDPEYYRNYQLTDKSDVYSFGVVLLELLTAQRAIDFCREPDDVNLAMYVRRLVDEERVMEAIDPGLREGAGELQVETMKALAFLAVGCLEEKRQNRPSMKEVAEEIDYIISVANSNN